MATSTNCDDLEYNPFYNALRNQYSRIFAQAQEDNYLICIPRIGCLAGVKLTQAFIESHLLKPSPYLKLLYSPMNNSNIYITLYNRDLFIEEHGMTRVKKTSVRVVADERGYTKDFKEYTICILNEPLVATKRDESHKKSFTENLELGNTYNSHYQYLTSFPKSADFIAKMTRDIDIFNKSYIIVQGFLSETATKLELLCSKYSQLFLSSLNSDLDIDWRVNDWIPVAVESFIMHGVHDKVYHAVCESLKSTDDTVGKILNSANSITPEQLGVSNDFCCEFSSAIVELARIEGLKTPIERLLCYRDTLKQIYNDVEAHVKKHQPLKCVFDEPVSVTADDLIPMLVFVLLQSKCQHLMANQYYLEHFNWSKSFGDDLSYTLVTYSAALVYIQSDIFRLLDNTHKLQNEISIDELVATIEHNKCVQTKMNDNTRSKPNSNPTQKLFNEKLDDISHAIANHCTELHVEPNKSTYRRFSAPSTSRTKKRGSQRETTNDDLGSFLSALSNDFQDVSYGHQ